MPLRPTLHPYRLPLRAPLRLAFGTLTERVGVLLRLEDEGGIGWGDCAPLPGFSPDSLPEATDALLQWIRSGDDTSMPPSARAALDGARLDLEALSAGLTVAQKLGPPVSPTVSLAALLTGADADLLTQAYAVRARGYRAAKLKVGVQPVEADAARVRRVAAALGPDVALRLDANRGWSYDDACRFSGLMADLNVAYIEEPLRDPSRLPELARETDLAIALDESLRDLTPADLQHHPYARAVILKPLVLGGIRAALSWAVAAKTAGMEAVVSGAFESGVGTRHALALASVLGGSPAGLDPYNLLAADVLHPRLPLDGPTVSVAEAFAPRSVRVG